MIEVEITEEMKKYAWRKSRQMGKLRGSITKGEGNIAGFLAECVVYSLLGGTIDNTYQWDLILPDNRKADIKCKRVTSPPKKEYDCSVTSSSFKKQMCDVYIFVRIVQKNRIWGKAYVLGWLSKDEYLKKSIELKVGDIDKSNGFRCKMDCLNVKISELNDINTLKNKDKKNEKN